MENKFCPDCLGDTLITSNCCGAGIYEETDICMDCKEHCEPSFCETCDGKGLIDGK